MSDDSIINLAGEVFLLENSIIFNSILNELSCNGNVIKLAYTESRTLELLISHAGDIVPREDITEFSWSGRVVTDSSLAKSISNIRKALRTLGLGDDSIITIPRVGYRLTCLVLQVSDEKNDNRKNGLSRNEGPSNAGSSGTISSANVEEVDLSTRSSSENKKNITAKKLVTFKTPSLILSLIFLTFASYNFMWSTDNNLDKKYLAKGYEHKKLTISKRVYEVITPNKQVLSDDIKDIISLAPSMSLVFLQKTNDIYNVSFFIKGKSSSFTFSEEYKKIATCRIKQVLSEGEHLCVM